MWEGCVAGGALKEGGRGGRSTHWGQVGSLSSAAAVAHVFVFGQDVDGHLKDVDVIHAANPDAGGGAAGSIGAGFGSRAGEIPASVCSSAVVRGLLLDDGDGGDVLDVGGDKGGADGGGGRSGLRRLAEDLRRAIEPAPAAPSAVCAVGVAAGVVTHGALGGGGGGHGGGVRHRHEVGDVGSFAVFQIRKPVMRQSLTEARH